MLKFDMIVIGSGIGLTLVEAAVLNKKTCAVIESLKFGGTCLTKGCIPSKVLVSPADDIRSIQHANKIGLDFGKPMVDWKTIARRMWMQIDKCQDIEKDLFNTKEVTVFKGIGEFTGEKTLRVMDKNGNFSQEITSDIIIVAPGARTYIPAIKGLEETGYLTSESFFADKFPVELMESIAILGAGAIGSEFVHIFSAMGVHVTLIELKDRVLPLEEEEISYFVKDNFESFGIAVHVDSSVVKISISGGKKKLQLVNNKTGASVDVFCDEIFVATGIRSNSDILKLERTRVTLDKKGWVITDETLETSQKGIWALGDINGKYQFRHKANYEGEICVHNIFNKTQEPHIVDYRTVPWAIFTYPQVAHVGLTQKQALEKEHRILVGTKHYSSIAKGFAMGYEKGDRDDGFVKLILDKNKKILGAHIVGPEASILIQSYVYMMNVNGSCIMRQERSFLDNAQDLSPECEDAGTVAPITQSMVIHPALSELTAWVIGEMKWVEL